MASIALTPAHDAVAPADALLPCCGGECSECEPATYGRVGSRFGCAAQYLGVTHNEPPPEPLAVLVDALPVAEPALALHEQLHRSCRILQLKPRVGAQGLDAQAHVRWQ